MILALLLAGAGFLLQAEDLVILHSNDTHSTIDPDKNGRGGVLQRKAIIDSVRKTEKNVINIHAGDLVQGSLYFKYFKGDVEYPLANMMKYDIQILGNHEFDNGMESLAKYYRTLKADRLSANYDFDGTPLEGLFEPYIIKKVTGKKIGFIGINLDPYSIISAQNYKGIKFHDIITSANETASYLKNKKHCDLVVVVSHIGSVKESERTTDYDLARASKDIDIIIGGHSHSTILPGTKESDRPGVAPGTDGFLPSVVANAEGRPVLVTQTGKYGRNIGYIRINLDNLAKETADDFEYRLIPVTDRFSDDRLDQKMKTFIAPFRAKVDSVNARVIAGSYYYLDSNTRTGGYPNLTGDFAQWYGTLKADSLQRAGLDVPRPDFSVMNVGGIRQSMPKGAVTEGEILATFPFVNHIVLQRVKGSDFVKAMRMAAFKGGEGVGPTIRVLTNSDGSLASVLLNGKPIDEERTYVMCTLDYVAEGNDDFTMFADGERLWTDPDGMIAGVMRYICGHGRYGNPIAPDPTPRFLPKAD